MQRIVLDHKRRGSILHDCKWVEPGTLESFMKFATRDRNFVIRLIAISKALTIYCGIYSPPLTSSDAPVTSPA